MTKYAIQVENLGKEYIIGAAEQRHDSFREMLTGALTSPLRKLRKLGGTASDIERFWALKDVSFNLEQGEVLGIIGRNGAGKSTLLKVLSRITCPSEGNVKVRGKLASLLEVGTGFHPELSGRENIYLNGAILGMPRKEVASKFDEIVAFSEIEKFVDTPVKRYSSGMYVRLAFSVAAHLDADVLLVDEVLAVGDAEFQRRCLGKMKDVSGGGRTVIFVSHNLGAIQTLCSKCVLLEHGESISTGDTASVVGNYLSRIESSNGLVHADKNLLKLQCVKGEYSFPGDGTCLIVMEIDFESLQDIPDLFIDFGIENEADVRLLQIMPASRGEPAANIAGNRRYRCLIRSTSTEFAPGDYYCTVYAHSKTYGVLLHQSRIKIFHIPPRQSHCESVSPGFTSVLLSPYSTTLAQLAD